MRLEELQAETSGLFGNADLPLAVTDESLQVVWANEYAARRFPDLKFTDGLLRVTGRKKWDDVLEQIRHGCMQVVGRESGMLELSRILLLPVMDPELVGCIAVFIFNFAAPADMGVDPSQQSRVVDSFSHAYRMPLTIIFSTLGLMVRHAECNDTMKSYIKLITQNCYRLYRTLNNLTEITRLAGGGAELHLKNGNITDYVRNLCRAAGILTASVGVPLQCDVPERKIVTAFDPDRLSTVFFNLLSNACKYTREGNHIRVRVEETGPNVQITVADSGLGIPPDTLEHVFDAYYSRDPDGRPYGSGGLGLSIAQYIIRLHGGTIAVQSREGIGTTVAFTLPVTTNPDLPDYVAANSVDYLSDRFSALYIEMSDVCGSPMP